MLYIILNIIDLFDIMRTLSEMTRGNQKFFIVAGIPEPDDITYEDKCYIFKQGHGEPVSITSLLIEDWEKFSEQEKLLYARMVFDNIMPFVIVDLDGKYKITENAELYSVITSDPFKSFR